MRIGLSQLVSLGPNSLFQINNHYHENITKQNYEKKTIH